jgi:hypothetical protein
MSSGKIRALRPAKKLAPLPALDVMQRYTIAEASRYLRQSTPKTYSQIKAGLLETFKQGRRRYATGRGIAKLSLPPSNSGDASAA